MTSRPLPRRVTVDDEGGTAVIEMSTTTSATVVTVAGDLDVSERESFPQVVTRVNDLRRRLLLIDLCRADFVDSAGAFFLVSLAERTLSRDGLTVLRGADDRCLFVLDVIGALQLFHVDEQHFCVDPVVAGAWPGASVLDGAGIETPLAPGP